MSWIGGNTLSSLLHMLLLRWHRFTRDNRAAILNNGTCGQVPAFRCVFRNSARQTYRQITALKESPAAVVSITFSFGSFTAGTSTNPSPAMDTRQESAPRFTTTSFTPALWVRAMTSSTRLLTPQRVFIVQRQEGDIRAFQHLLVHLLCLFFAGPQARTIVIVENHFSAVGAAFAQQESSFSRLVGLKIARLIPLR